MPKFDFKRKDSDKPLFSVNAVSIAQAIVKGRQAHPSMEYLDDHIERGLIVVVPEQPLDLPPEAKSKEGPICPNCGSTNVRPGRGANELQCMDCGWSWEPDVEEAINTLLNNNL